MSDRLPEGRGPRAAPVARIITDPAEAPDICGRHNLHDRLEQVIDALRAGLTGDVGALEAVGRALRSRGAVLDRFATASVVGWITSPAKWVVTGANRPDTGSSGPGGHFLARLPDRWPGAMPLVDLPTRPQDCTPAGRRVAAEVWTRPAVAAAAVDVCVDPGVTGGGYAGAVTCKGFERIRELDPEIRYVLGEVLVVTGVRFTDGSAFRLTEHGLDPLVNEASLRANMTGPGAAVPVWVVHDRDDLYPGRDGEVLEIDWIVLAHELGAGHTADECAAAVDDLRGILAAQYGRDPLARRVPPPPTGGM